MSQWPRTSRMLLGSLLLAAAAVPTRALFSFDSRGERVANHGAQVPAPSRPGEARPGTVAVAAVAAPGPRAPSVAPAAEAPEGVAYEVARGELIVEAASEADGAALAARLSSELGALAVARIGYDPAFRVTLPEDARLSDALARVRRWRGVAAATPDAVTRGTSSSCDRVAGGVRVPWHVAAVDPPASAVDERVVIAVLDSGLAHRSHVDAAGRARGRAPWLDGVALRVGADLVGGDASPDDWNGHGTHVASILVGPTGLARGATLLPVQVLDEHLSGTEAGLVGGIDYAVAQRARVINLSLVFGAGYYPSRLLDRAVSRALRAGVVVVAAAGNDARPEVRFPAAFPGVIAVGASTLGAGGQCRAHDVARYASTGAALDLLAPGGDLGADADGDGVPDGVVGVTFDPRAPTHFAPWLFAGSSQAAAHVAAAAAHLLSAGIEPAAVAGRLREGAEPVGGRAFAPEKGAGALNIARALRVAGPRPGELGVRLTAAMAGPTGGRVVRAGVAVIDREGRPQHGVTVHARWRGGFSGPARCATDRQGVCALESGPLAGRVAAASLEVAAVVDASGRAVRPADVFVREREVEPVLAALESGAPGVLVWHEAPAEGPATYLLRGLAVDTALAPTVVALDEPAFRWATGGETGGTGFGSSSFDYYLFPYSSGWFWNDPSLTSWSGGAGFGSSSWDLNSYYAWSYWTVWSWGAWGTDSSLWGAQFAPGEVLGAATVARAASVDATAGAGRGMPRP